MSRFALPLAVVVAVLVVAAPAAAGVSVTSVNTGGFPTVHATVVSSLGSAAAPRLTENGRPVAGLIAQNLGYISPEQGQQLLDKAAELGRIMNGLAASIRSAA